MIIPLFRVISHALEKAGNDELFCIKQAINDGLKQRMGEKRDAKGVIKRHSWDNNRELVLSTILDPRFKLSSYFSAERHIEYISWLTLEAERAATINVINYIFYPSLFIC